MKRRPGGFVLRVNPILCDGFGHCAELAPDLVHLDEWGYPIIVSEPVPLGEPRRPRVARATPCAAARARPCASSASPSADA